MRTLALEACQLPKLFRFGNEQWKLTQLPRWTLSRQQEQLPEVQRHEGLEVPKSPGSGMSSEDLAPYLGDRWKGDTAPQVPAEVGMCAPGRGSIGWILLEDGSRTKAASQPQDLLLKPLPASS